MKYSQHFQRGHTPQSEPADPKQVKNSAGGYSFVIDHWKRLERFLVLGTEGGSYYASERKLTRDNAKSVDACLSEDPERAVQKIVEVSVAGRAPKNDPAIFALVLAASHPHPAARKAGLAAVSAVCRTGTHLFQFVDAVGQQRGWGRGLREAVAAWYASKPPDRLMYQLAKYRQRGGWSHRDVLRKCHWEPTAETQAIARWAVGAPTGERSVARGKDRKVVVGYQAGPLPDYLLAFDELQSTDRFARVLELIGKYRFTHEMIPSQWHGRKELWEALLPDMPLGALVRNLGRLTANGLLKPLSNASSLVVSKLSNGEALRKSRLHPLSLVMALYTYKNGKGLKGSLTWTPVPTLLDALDDAFYASFGNVEPTGKHTLLALDVSGSMAVGNVAGTPLSPRDASAVLAMVTARTESNYCFWAFSRNMMELNISANQRLDSVIHAIDNLPFDATDCALPMMTALERKLDVDVFHIYTDSETWVGFVHPHQALQRYRNKTGIGAKLAVVGMVANDFTIANPADAGMLDVVGMDTSVPNVLADFARGLLG